MVKLPSSLPGSIGTRRRCKVKGAGLMVSRRPPAVVPSPAVGCPGVDSGRTTRAAIAGISMAFLSVILIFLGRDLLGWAGVLLSGVLIVLIARALQPLIVRWITGPVD